MEIPKDSSNIINDLVLKEPQVLKIIKNKEISNKLCQEWNTWNQNEVNIDDVFAYNIVLNIINDIEDQEPNFISDC